MMLHLPQLLQQALAGCCLLLWAAVPAASQPCTPDWGKCGWQASSLGPCCSPQFGCVKKGDWYWQCVQQQQQAPPPPPPPTTTAPPPRTTVAPATQAPEAAALASVRSQVKSLEGGTASKVAGEVSRLSGLAAELAEEGREAEGLAGRVERQAGQAGTQSPAADFAGEAARLASLTAKLEAKTKQMADSSANVLQEAQAAAQRAGLFAGEAAQDARLAAALPGAKAQAASQRAGFFAGEAAQDARLAAALPGAKATSNSKGQPGYRGQPISIEVYYSPTGMRSHDFVKKDLSELVGLSLPGSMVNVTVLPAVPRLNGGEECVANVDCSFARAQVCASRALQQPAAGDDPALQDFLSFLACDLSKTSRLEEGAPGCAKGDAQASALQRCSEGKGSKAGMAEAAEKTAGVQARFKALDFKELPRKPWVFVGGRLLNCRKGLCSAEGSSADAVGFVEYVCHKLAPMPKACEEFLTGTSSPAENPAVKVLPSSALPSPLPVGVKDVPCPDNADLQDCIDWCNQVAPGSSPTFAGQVCSKMGTKELDFGMLPQCKCYDGKMENVLKQCSSSCTHLGGSSSASVAKALDAVEREMEPRQKGPVDVAVLYSTHCPACREFISHGLAQLMRAGLPGPEVNVSLLPMDAGSAMARTQLCAMRQTQLQPMAVDGPSLKRGLDYIVCCDLSGGVDRASAVRCAAQTGFDWKSLEQCAEGPDGREMAIAATRATARVQELLKGRGFQRPPGIPWVFVQGTLLRCSGTLCAHEILPAAPGQLTHGLHEGARPLAQGGGPLNFVQYVCSRLSPQPPACGGTASLQPSAVEVSAAPMACENCFLDFGHPLQRRHGQPLAPVRRLALPAAACVAAACAALLAATVVRGGLRRGGPVEDQGSFSLLPPVGSAAAVEDSTPEPLVQDVEQAPAHLH